MCDQTLFICVCDHERIAHHFHFGIDQVWHVDLLVRSLWTTKVLSKVLPTIKRCIFAMIENKYTFLYG